MQIKLYFSWFLDSLFQQYTMLIVFYIQSHILLYVKQTKLLKYNV